MLKWGRYQRRPGIWLQFETDPWPDVTEEDIDAIIQWCETNQCGRRQSYSMWEFRTEAEVTAFLLRWS